MIPLQGGVSDHTAYNVTFADPIANVEPVARDVPDASDAVFQPAKVYPLRARLPALSTATVAPCWYDVESVGTEPDDPLAGLL